MDRATIQCPTVGMVTGVEYPVPRVNGTADQFRGAGGRMLLPAGGLAVWGRWSRLTGSGVPAAAPLIIPSQIGEGRLEAGVIRSQANKSRAIPGTRSLFGAGGFLSFMEGRLEVSRWTCRASPEAFIPCD